METSTANPVYSPVTEYLKSIHEAGLRKTGGALADYIPELANQDPTLFGLSLCTPEGIVYSVGDSDTQFSIQSVSKPFVYAMALADRGLERVNQSVGEEPSGDPFNSISLDEKTGRPDNPMINIGAVTTHALVHSKGASREEREKRILAGMSAFAGRELSYDDAVYESEIDKAWRNLALAALVRANDLIISDPAEVVRGYTRQCSALVTTKDLAVMGMTLASGGVNPQTGERVVPEWVAQQVLSVMTTCGMYDAAGDWLTNVGIPAKSGVSGGIMGSLPGQMGAAAFSPPIDKFGNSVRGVDAFERMSEDLGLHMMKPPSPILSSVLEKETDSSGRLHIHIQGSMDFSLAEKALRSILETPQNSQPIVIDFRSVPSVSLVGYKLLHAGIFELKRRGHTVTILDPNEHFADLREEVYTSLSDIEPTEEPVDSSWFAK